jgi:RNA polymerase sigma-70 factor (ECF subfamily)
MFVSLSGNRFTTEEQVLNELPAPRSEQSEHYQSELASVLIVLPDEQREVLLMRFVDDLSLQEIAAALDIPLGTVKSRLHNALQVLRNDRRTRDYFLE